MIVSCKWCEYLLQIGAILERARAETKRKEEEETVKVNAEIEARKRARLERELQKGKREREEQSTSQVTMPVFITKLLCQLKCVHSPLLSTVYTVRTL